MRPERLTGERRVVHLYGVARSCLRISAAMLTFAWPGIWAVAAGTAMAASPLPNAAAAGFLDEAGDARRQIPDIPDRRGCVRQCDQDTAPCDPIIYKRADGRCTNDY